MPRAICTATDCIYYSELVVGKCELESIRLDSEGTCQDLSLEHREIK